MDDQRRLLALCAIRIEGRSIDWSLLAREAQLWQGLDRLEAGRFHEDSKDAQDGLPLLVQGLKRIDEARARVDQELAIAERAGARLVTVLDDEYPARLRAIFNLTPFLFVQGRRCSAVTHGRSRWSARAIHLTRAGPAGPSRWFCVTSSRPRRFARRSSVARPVARRRQRGRIVRRRKVAGRQADAA